MLVGCDSMKFVDAENRSTHDVLVRGYISHWAGKKAERGHTRRLAPGERASVPEAVVYNPLGGRVEFSDPKTGKSLYVHKISGSDQVDGSNFVVVYSPTK